MSIDYADEKYAVAVHSLATGPGRVQERLHSAAMSLTRLQEGDDLPDPEMRAEHKAIMAMLTTVKHDPHERGLFQVTLDAMSDDDAHDLAERILNLFLQIQERVAAR